MAKGRIQSYRNLFLCLKETVPHTACLTRLHGTAGRRAAPQQEPGEGHGEGGARRFGSARNLCGTVPVAGSRQRPSQPPTRPNTRRCGPGPAAPPQPRRRPPSRRPPPLAAARAPAAWQDPRASRGRPARLPFQPMTSSGAQHSHPRHRLVKGTACTAGGPAPRVRGKTPEGRD